MQKCVRAVLTVNSILKPIAKFLLECCTCNVCVTAATTQLQSVKTVCERSC